MIAYAMEGPTNPLQELYVIGNTMVDRNSGLFIRSRLPNATFVADNIMTGPGMLITGAGVFVSNVLAVGMIPVPAVKPHGYSFGFVSASQ